MAEHKLQIGEKLPHFILNDETHQPVDISTLTGKFLIIYFYPKDDTPGCVKEACSFRDSFQELVDVGNFISSFNKTVKALHSIPWAFNNFDGHIRAYWLSLFWKALPFRICGSFPLRSCPNIPTIF